MITYHDYDCTVILNGRAISVDALYSFGRTNACAYMCCHHCECIIVNSAYATSAPAVPAEPSTGACVLW